MEKRSIKMDSRWQRLSAGKALAHEQREAASEWHQLSLDVEHLQQKLATLRPMSRWEYVASRLAIVVLVALVLGFFAQQAFGAQVPSAAHQHQRELTRLAQQEFGLDARVALFGAQIHQESSWRRHAESPYAEGLAQFTPDTAQWISDTYPDLGKAAPFSPGWAMRAMLRYNRHLLSNMKPWNARDVPDCDRWAFVLSAYNGGPGWVPRDRRLAAAEGADPDRWWGHVEHHTARADWAREENRGYPRRILHELEPRYLRAGWRGRRTCR